MNESVEVAIVGAGPVGMMVAALLGQRGIQCMVIEKSSTICTHPRAQTIDDESIRTLQSIGLADAFLETTLEAQGSHYYDKDGECFATVGPGPKNYGYPKRNYMLQQRLDQALFDYMQSFDCIDVRLGHEVTELTQDNDRATLTIAGRQQITARYVLACDGGQSRIRNWLNIQLEGWTYSQDWIVLDMNDDPDHDRVSRFFCNPQRPAVSIASPQGGRRYEFMVMPGETRDTVLSDAFLSNLLKPFRAYDPQAITRRAVYTFHARIANALRQERVLLLGDAAHMTPPFAGQGMNAGIRDAHNLAWKLACVLRNGASDSILNSYDDERRGPIWAMIQLAVAMGEFVMPVSDEQVHLTESMMLALQRFPGVQSWLFEMKFKPKPRYDQGLFVDLDNQPFEASLVGEMMPQPSVRDAHNQTRRLDELLGNGFALLAQDEAGDAALTALNQPRCHPLWQTLKPQTVRLVTQASHPISSLMHVGYLTDDIYARPLRTHRDQILLVRPDRYVAGACMPADLNTMASQMAQIIGIDEAS